jgi:hypothetical protein
MIPAEWNFTIYQGATFRRTLTLNESDGVTPVDLTGCTLRMQLREELESATPAIELTNTNGRLTILDQTTNKGKVRVLVTDEETAALTFDSAVFDMELEYADGTVDRILEGKVTLDKEVTR